jgi:hypothetical protein
MPPHLDRREFLVSTAALLMLPTADARAEGTCGPPQCRPDGYCEQACMVGLPSTYVDLVAARQAKSQWCWAACIEMVFAAHGYRLPQQAIVEQTWGSAVDMPGDPSAILAAINRTYVDSEGRRFQAFGDALTANVATAIQDLANRQPLIIGALGHATVLTAITWASNNLGQQLIVSATVRDPWPESPSKRTLSPQEWANVSFAARVRCVPA